MVLAALILILSAGLFLFFLHATCERILRREFDREYYPLIANANRLEFPSVRKELEEFDAPLELARVRMTLQCDFLALTYLLKNALNERRRLTQEERLLNFYFRALSVCVVACHGLGLREKPVLLKLTTILEYFANVIGRRVNVVRVGALSPSDYLLNI